MQKAGEKPPAGIEVKGGKWLIPVQHARTRNDGQAHALMLALNRTVELGGTDDEKLAALLKDLHASGDLGASGYSGDDLDDLLHDLGQQAKDDADAVPPVPKKPISKTGDLWTLGEHRILCGDSTKPEDVARVMGKGRAMLMATDPPYGIDYSGGKDGKGVRPKGISGKTGGWPNVANDIDDGPKLQAFLESAFRAAVGKALAPNAAWYLWHAHLTQGFFAAAAAAAAAVKIHRQIIWVKPVLMFGRGDYHWKHELCFYGWVETHRPPFYGKRNQTTVWEISNETNPKDRKHPTQKPAALWDAPIRNHTKPGEFLYEPFSGSGTQIIAAEKTSRRCRAIEIEPRYVDVAVERWQTFAHGKATRQSR
jgi:DNA modification methylase